MKRLAILFLFLFVGANALTLRAQDTFEEWKKQQQQEYKQFRDERDKAFLKFLEERWKFVESYSGSDMYEDPKPTDIPQAEKKEENTSLKKDGPKVKIKDIPEPEPEPQPEPEPTVERQQETVAEPDPPQEMGEEQQEEEPIQLASVAMDFFNTPLEWEYDPAIKTDYSPADRKKQEKAISQYWEKISKSRYPGLLEICQARRNQLRLNDWGYAYMLHELGGNIYGQESHEQQLFTWFMLVKSGYNARVGYNEEEIRILLPVKNGLFNTPYYTVDGVKYYGIKFREQADDAPELYTYDGDYPGADSLVSMNLSASPGFKKDYSEKELSFTYEGTNYDFKIPYNKNLVSFYEEYPQTDLRVYFTATVDHKTSSSLLKQFKPLLEGKTEAQAVNMILRFVQTAFDYKVDKEQFGREKYMLPEETLYYPASDCEDRCILFSYMVRNLVGLDVIGLKYKGHLATAVAFSETPQGDSLTYKEKTYTIADPTYINADIGMTMPKYKEKSPSVVEIPE